MYYLLSRLYNQLIDEQHYAKYDFIAKQMHDEIDVLRDRNIGPQFLMLLKKR